MDMTNDEPVDWRQQLFDLLEAGAAEQKKKMVLPIHWSGRPDVVFDMLALDGKPRAIVNDQLIALLDKVDPAKLLPRLANDKERETWKRYSVQMRNQTGKTVSLHSAVCVVGVPLASTWTTLANNVYSQTMKVNTADVVSYLPPNMQAKVMALGKEASLMAIGKALGFGAIDSDGKPGGESNTDGDDEPIEQSIWELHRNVIFFGPPGTGKSHEVAKLVEQHLHAKGEDVYRVTFHPEYTYFDFVGSYRPAVGWAASAARFIDVTGKARQEEPRIYYNFEPGPLSQALRAAAQKPLQSVVLIIEEINRGNCAAIFGDVFQLLDRLVDEEHPTLNGVSQYAIVPSSEWADWLERELGPTTPAWHQKRLKLPANLYLYATMNTSDQSLFPMDTAFRRRWGMSYRGITADSALSTRVPLNGTDKVGVLWRELMEPLNAAIVEHTGTDDKQMGAWFIKPTPGQQLVDHLEFSSKVLYYLWSDVFRDEPGRVFVEGVSTYDTLVRRYDAGKSVFAPAILDKLKKPATQLA